MLNISVEECARINNRQNIERKEQQCFNRRGIASGLTSPGTRHRRIERARPLFVCLQVPILSVRSAFVCPPLQVDPSIARTKVLGPESEHKSVHFHKVHGSHMDPGVKVHDDTKTLPQGWKAAWVT